MSDLIATVNDAVAAWVPGIVRSCWQGGLALGAVWIACRCMTRIPPAVQCWLWRLAFLKLLVAFAWASPFELRLLPAGTGDATDRAGVVRVAGNSDPQHEEPADTTAGPPIAAGAEMTERIAERSGLHATGWLFIGWALGVVACVLRLVRDWIHMRRLVAGLPRIVDERVLAETGRACHAFRLLCRPELRQFDDHGGPFLVGTLRPVIVLPTAMLKRSTPEELRAALAHELAHVKRRDLIWNWLPAVAEAISFFHPVVWIARREWGACREIATDELALGTSGLPPEAYGRALLDLVTTPDAGHVPRHLAVAVSETFAQLSRRLTAMKLFRPRSRRNRRITALLLAAITVFGVIPWRLTAQEANSKLRSAPTPGSAAPEERTASQKEATGASQIYVRGTVYEEDAHRGMAVAIVDLESGIARRLLHDRTSQYRWFNVSPDGSTIVYDKDGTPSNPGELWNADAATVANPGRIFHTAGPTIFSPDAATILVDTYNLNANTDNEWEHQAYRMRSDGLAVSPVDALKGYFLCDWSPDGMWLLATTSKLQVHLVRLDGTESRQVVQRGEDPRFSPDGRWISFAKRWGGEVHVIGIDGSGERKVYHEGAMTYVDGAEWSPDGHHLAVVVQDLVHAGGGKPVRVSDPQISNPRLTIVNVATGESRIVPVLRQDGWQFCPAGELVWR